MTDTATKVEPLTLTDELILMLLDEKGGYFHQIPGWQLSCAIIGGALAELSFRERLDSDLTSLFVVDPTETGDPILDPILSEMMAEEGQHNAQYWIERLVPRSDSIVDETLDRMVDRGILQHHEGDFWTLNPAIEHGQRYGLFDDPAQDRFVKARIGKIIFVDEIPDPRDIVIVSLVNSCDVFRLMFEIDDPAEERINFICQLDLIGRSIADAVTANIGTPLRRAAALSREIPTVPLTKMLRHPYLRSGNLAGLMASLADDYGPVFQIRPPFQKRMVFLAGAEANQWVHKRGRLYLRARDYLEGLEKVYGAAGILPALDGHDHFRLRKFLAPSYSRVRLAAQLDEQFDTARAQMATLEAGKSYPAIAMARELVNAQLAPALIGIDTQDIMEDLIEYKERVLIVHLAGILPKFTLNTPGMKRRAKTLGTLMDRVLTGHTPAQRVNKPRDLVDDYLSLHGSDPQFFPECNLLFAFSAAMIASLYVGDTLGVVLCALISQPDLYERVQAEADKLFGNGDPSTEDFTPDSIDVTRRVLMESLRMYPIVPMSIRTVMNSCAVANYELPVGERLYIAQTATHYMSDVFPEPTKFDIDRYLPSRREHRAIGYAPYGLGTHKCLGTRWMEMMMAANLLMLTHYFKITVSPQKYALKPRFNAVPTLSASKKVKFHIVEQRHELPS